ncbi:alkaline phosphatase family protein [Nocardioides dongxiaopingii]|uniref:alkaline phosphatase family protein n=1 Tax=Nocardioides dongxiaopingii TaxID=2576036 RepID=UPI0010C761B2|nr:alkaline phosphatase family protein [Nocardioides dongxiaopingii]
MTGRGSLSRRAALAGREVAHWRPSLRWLRAVLRSFVVSFLAVAVTLWLVPGQQVPEHGTRSVATLVLVVLLVGALLRPILTRLTVITGVLGLLLVGFLAQSVVLGVALALVPSIEPIDFPELVVAAWGVAVVAAVLNWVVDASSEEVYLAQVLGRAVRTARRSDVSGPGLLVVQLDGVAEPLLRQAAAAGAIPFVTRTLRSGSHVLRGWHTGVPSTTPAGQAVLLHGEEHAIPAFRWYDKERGRVLECSRPADAAVAESDFTTGRGLLADGGASVANLFSGDAPFRALTMSDARLPGSEPGAAQFAASRSGFVRSVVLFAGQVVTEWYQGRRQRHRNVVPRVHRGGSFVFLRGLTTVVLKDLSVAIVAEQMARGTPVVYVDFVDYDEVAHHAGPTRPESMRTFESLDRSLEFFADLAREVGRDYEIAVVSDHGQTQGSTFLQLEGRTLAQAVGEIVDLEVDAQEAPAEVMGPANLLAASGTPTHGALRPHRFLARRRPAPAPAAGSPVQVVASGSIAHLYLTGLPGRLHREDVEEALPRLLPGLCALTHVGVVLTRTRGGAVVVENAAGRRVLGGSDAGAWGADPLAPYGPLAAADLLALDARHHVGDVVVLGRYDPQLGEVAAFEELVGSHGGLGGWQTEALLVHPAGWTVPDGPLGGGDVHRLLVRRLVELGLRRSDEAAVPDLEAVR